MITSTSIQNFKCFRQDTFEMRKLTLLTGLNGAGKSSFIQALLLAQQTVSAGLQKTVLLNGPKGLALGQAGDLLPFGTGEREIKIAIQFTIPDGDSRQWNWKFAVETPDLLSLHADMQDTPLNSSAPSELHDLNFAYLHAERLGPRNSLPISPGRALHVGPHGEYTAHVLASRYREVVRSARLHPEIARGEGDEDPLITLDKQVERWMGTLVPGIEIRSSIVPSTLQAALNFSKGGFNAEFVRATNMGFGVSYTLPIVVEGLLLPPGSLLIVENPEAHMHPAGQSKLGRFLALLAADGVQVVIETHSDHVLNGVRLAAIQQDHPLRRDDVIIHFFHGEVERTPRATVIEIDKKGGLTVAPEGFFDQSAKDFKAILDARTLPAQTARYLKGQAAKGPGEGGVA